MKFFDPNKPIATCDSENCEDCAVKNSIHCHFKAKDLIHFLVIAFPGFLLGGAGIYHMSGWSLVLWIALIVGFFGFVEIRVMCSHCPHYAEPGKSLKCWANYGSPKLWKYRPGPMSFGEKFSFFGGFVIIWGYPIIFLLSGGQWFLLLVYTLSAVGFFMTLKIFFCTQCMNFACPLNAVEEGARQGFFGKNPEVARAWGKNK
ncbi:hypothetical protein ACFL4G_00730 [Thermodesulfobacteriota bacterium]